VEHGQLAGSSIAVARVTIDSLDLSDVRFMKLDVEGHELAALRGAARRLSQSLARRAVWQHPRYVNMVLFRPDEP
jgi:FkbM family methyltransferase